MRSLLVLCMVLTVLVLSDARSHNHRHKNYEKHLLKWDKFVEKRNKPFRDDHHRKFRQELFLERAALIDEHNENLYDNGEVSYRLRYNEFVDRTPEELKNMRMSTSFIMEQFEKFQNMPVPHLNIKNVLGADVCAPASFDWRKKGGVNPVKNQGQCGSCWAFSTIAAIETGYFSKYGVLPNLSEQQLTDCGNIWGTSGLPGCNGSWPADAMNYFNGYPIQTNISNPYLCTSSYARCNRNPPGGGPVKIKGFSFVTPGDENELALVVSQIGPVVVLVNASSIEFATHVGLYDSPGCHTRQYNHAVTVIGYDTTTDGIDYWIVRNSWGTDFGHDGYFWLPRNRGDYCGITDAAVYPIIA